MTDVPVLGLLLLAAVVSAPWWIRRLRPGATHAPVRVVGRTALSRNAVVAVVQVGDRRLLVGAAEHGVTVLTELGAELGAELEADPHTGPDVAAELVAASDLAPTLEGRTDAVPTLTGPRIGPLDRLRAMTVRTTPTGRPIRVPLRR